MTTIDDRYLEFDNHVIFTYIDQWEKHSIAKIHLAAREARNNAKQLFLKRHVDFVNLLSEINQQSDTSTSPNDDLDKRTRQLTKLRQEVSTFSSAIHLERETNQWPIYLIKLSHTSENSIQSTDQDRNEDSIDVPGTEPLSMSRLNRMSPSEQKQMLGERLFPLVQQIEPSLAAKMTGMFLEFNIEHILILIKSQETLHVKIKEASKVLQAHRYQQRHVIK